MRRGVIALATGALTLGLILGCGGEFDQAWREGVSQQIDEIDGSLWAVDDGPAKDKLRTTLETARADALSGKIGVWEVAELKVKVDEALADGSLTEDEASRIEAFYGGLGG